MNIGAPNTNSGIFRLACSQLGKNAYSTAQNILIENALKTLNYSFISAAEYEISTINNLADIINVDSNSVSFTTKLQGHKYMIALMISDNNKYYLYKDDNLISNRSNADKKIQNLRRYGQTTAEKKIIDTIVRKYNSIIPEINSRLIIDNYTACSLQPGNVYIKKISRNSKRRDLLKTYFKEDSDVLGLENNGNAKTSDAKLRKIIFIELEITPPCDYAQDKWLKSRFLPGILIPEQYTNSIPENHTESLYTELPLLKINNRFYKPVFEFRLLKSIDKNTNNLGNVIFRIRKEVCADIQSRLSSHTSRIGITCVE